MMGTPRTLAMAVAFGGLAIVSTASAATADSTITQAFVAAVRTSDAILATADDLALTRSDAPRIRAFARRTAASAASANDALDDWARAERIAADAAARAPTVDGLGPVFSALDRPFDHVITSIDEARVRRPAQADLAQLEALQGRDFDDLYGPTQIAALVRLEAAYIDYIKNGDDTVLRALSVRNLPRTQHLLAAARRL